jgi:diguanylate cyclase (GGDEF)-like protein/PAS domain S-box-containing protein
MDSPLAIRNPSPHGLRRGDLAAIRQIVAMEVVATLVFGVLHRWADPAAVDPFWERVLIAGLCTLFLALTYRARARHLAALLYLLYYGFTAWAIQLLVLNHFHPNYAIAAMVVLASVCMGFLNFGPLLRYLAVALTAVAFTLWYFPAPGAGGIDPVLFVSYLVLFSALGYLTLRGRVRAQEQLAASRAHYALTAEAANDGLWDWDFGSDRVYYSPRWKSMLGLPEETVGDTPGEWLDRIHPEDAERVCAALVRHREGATDHFESEFRIRRVDGDYAWVLARGLVLRDESGRAQQMAGSQTDITDRKRTEAQLLHEALHDALTGLPNRALLLDRLRQVFRRRHRHADPGFAVLFLDLDRFKVINDSLGHAAGDELLVAVTRRLKASVREEDTVARMGGDEFAIVLADLPGETELTGITSRILAEVAAPVRLRHREVVTTASIGIAIGPEGYASAEEMLRDADLAMYRAKGQGPGQYVIFDQAMQSRALAALELETDLRRAIELEQLHLQYQPIVSFPARHLTGFEALVRWHCRRRGVLSPLEFIPLAEQTGLIIPLGRWVLQEACRQMREWQSAAGWGGSLTISVNVSGRQLTHPGFVADVSDALEASGLDPECLRLELTESVLLSDPDAALDVLARLHALGVQLHLDDFGTGYSSFSYLHRFPIDAVKIDRSFVSGMDSNPRNAAIVRTLVILAQTLGVSVFAEGVETTEEFAQLEEIRCPAGQGFLFAPPLDPGDAEALLRSAAAGETVAMVGATVG